MRPFDLAPLYRSAIGFDRLANLLEQRFQLANHVKVTTASFDNGMLTIELVREVPEAHKPRKIVIDGGDNVQQLEQRQAA